MLSMLCTLTPVSYCIAQVAAWPHGNNTVVALSKALNGKHWTADVQIKTSSSDIAIVPLIIDSSISHMLIMSQLLCDLHVCDGCGYSPPTSGTCLPLNPTPSPTSSSELLVDGSTVALYSTSHTAAVAFLNHSFPSAASTFQVAVPADSDNDRPKIMRGASFWNGTAGR